MKEKCVVCKENDSKYRCTSCRLCYCSLECSKIHKIECNPPTISINEAKHDKKREYGDDEFLLLSIEQKYALANSYEIQDAIKSTRLKNELTAIDSAKDRQSILKRARNNPEFEEFINKILKVINKPSIQLKNSSKKEEAVTMTESI